jgi:hypothetical protein
MMTMLLALLRDIERNFFYVSKSKNDVVAYCCCSWLSKKLLCSAIYDDDGVSI